MAKDRKDLGARRHVRVDMRQVGFLIPAPDAPWIQCFVRNVSEKGACLEVGDLALPKLFGLTLTPSGEVLRICKLIWRRGELAGVRFLSGKELRQGSLPTDQPEANRENLMAE